MSDFIPLILLAVFVFLVPGFIAAVFRSDILKERLKRVPWFGLFASFSALMQLVDPLVSDNAEYDLKRVSLILLWASMAGASFAKNREKLRLRDGRPSDKKDEINATLPLAMLNVDSESSEAPHSDQNP
jgi:hypothetical protein